MTNTGNLTSQPQQQPPSPPHAPSRSIAPSKNYAQDPVNQSLTNDQKVEFLSQMYRIRRFEQAALRYYNQGKMGGFLHLYIGQESIAVATVSVLTENDHIITAYRDHGHALAVGMTMNECMAELFGKRTGCSKGKGGSMHFFAPDKRFWGGHGIVAGQTPLGLGIAFALKYRGIRGACFTFLGDGAVNQGVFSESLNLASLWNIPVIFVIENNLYSMGTSLRRSSAIRSCLAQRAEGFNMPWDTVDGANFYEVRSKLAAALSRAHEESRPTLLEIFTYRHYGHSVADANAKKYRSEEEIELYKQYHDPIRHWQNTLLEEGVITAEDAEEIDRAAKQEAADSAAFAEASDYPSLDELFDDVYWEIDNKTPTSKYGRYFFGDDVPQRFLNQDHNVS
ncbi:MAG: pyruvate dehydrogenase (acetyl-transferring) E1 component subunit alpha [Chthoniobacterales bacterium]|nr:pyruvate dehydrogenase (acetyl-transferring) E1 component subunit alpha [Chthoniobacterales bacterium]